MVSPIHMHAAIAARSVAHAAPVGVAAPAVAAQPAIASVLDASDASGHFGLYTLDNGQLAVAASGLATGAPLPADGVTITASGKPWSSGRTSLMPPETNAIELDLISSLPSTFGAIESVIATKHLILQSARGFLG